MVAQLPNASDFVTLREAMDRLVNESFVGGPFRTFWSTSTNGAGRMPLPIDVYSTDEEVVVVAAAPGMQPDDVQITTNQNTITLSGQIRTVAASENAKHATWYVHELPSGSFQRSVTLPIEVDASRADATFEHGILRLTLPKAEQAKPKQIKVRVADSTPIAAETPSAD